MGVDFESGKFFCSYPKVMSSIFCERMRSRNDAPVIVRGTVRALLEWHRVCVDGLLYWACAALRSCARATAKSVTG